MNHIHSSELPTPTKPPEFRPPRTFMAVALIPTVLLHIVWMNGLSPPFDFLLFLFTILLCFLLDYISINIVWNPFKRVEENAFWWFAYCCQFGYNLVAGDFLISRRMDALEISPKIKTPVMMLLGVISFFVINAGIGALSELNLRNEIKDKVASRIQEDAEGLMLREQAKQRREERRRENKARAKQAKAMDEEELETEEEDEDLRIYIS